MSVSFGIAIYFIIWWVVLFTTLPFGARSSHEAGEKTVEGADAGAPLKPRLLLKFVATTIISAILFAGFYVAYTSGYFKIGA